MKQGLEFLKEKMIEKYHELKIGTTLKTPTATSTITDISYDQHRNSLIVTIDNGQRASAGQIRKAIESGLMEIQI